MKSSGLIAIVVFFLMSDNIVIKAQSEDLSIRQIELMSRSLGIWKTIISSDTTEFWDMQHYGQGFIVNVYQVVKGKKIPQHFNIACPIWFTLFLLFSKLPKTYWNFIPFSLGAFFPF